jgi:ABC-type nitrate/sulfonate/bicarbonate transport system permease component
VLGAEGVAVARLEVARLIPIALLGLAWEVVARSGAVTRFMLPALRDVLNLRRRLLIWHQEASE